MAGEHGWPKALQIWPTAQPADADVKLMTNSPVIVAGRLPPVQVDPPSTLLSTLPPVSTASPAINGVALTHPWLGVTNATPRYAAGLDGSDCCVQLAPPFVVRTRTPPTDGPPPTAHPSRLLIKVTPARGGNPAGSDWVTHVAPPLLVASSTPVHV